jgi:hypothetical protein
MTWLYFFLVLAGLISFLLAIPTKQRQTRWNLVALGLAFWILVDVIIRFRAAAGV